MNSEYRELDVFDCYVKRW